MTDERAAAAPAREGDGAVRRGLPRPSRRRSRSTSRRFSPGVSEAVRRYLAVSGLVLVAVGVPTGLVLSAAAHELAVRAAVDRADRFADGVVGPVLAMDPLGRPSPEGLEALEGVVSTRVTDGSVHGVRVWDLDGQLVFSAGDVHTEAATAFAASTVLAQDGDVAFHDEDHVHVVVTADSSAGDPLLVEVLVPLAEVLRVEHQLRWPFVLSGLVGLLVLTAAQLPLAVSLARRVQQSEHSRRLLLTQAVAASELERRRLAQQLHDDVIQDLAGLGYELDSIARHVPEKDRPPVVAARELVQQDVAKLRDILADVYPRQVEPHQLENRLSALADTLRDQGSDVHLDVHLSMPLDVERATLVHRVAREALTNVTKHAHAERVHVSVDHGHQGTELHVRDDGRGFDTSDDGSVGHVGLRLVDELVHELGGELSVVSEPGSGTAVTLRLPPD